MSCRYSMVIQWSDEDQVYVVSLPEFGRYAKTHGATYEEAVRKAEEVLELLREDCQAEGMPLPRPVTLDLGLPTWEAAEETIPGRDQ